MSDQPLRDSVSSALIRRFGQYGLRPPAVLLLLALLVLTGWTIRVAEAAEHRLTPSISARTTYDDNIFFDGESGYEAAVTPALQYRYATGRGHLNLSGQGDIYRYLDNDEYDRVNQEYTADGLYELNQYLALGLNGLARFDHTFEQQLEETGELTDKEQRTTLSGRPSVTFSLTPRMSARVQGSYRQVEFDDPEERDYELFGGSLSLVREWTPQATVSLNLQYSRSEPEDDTVRQSGLEVGFFDQTQDSYQLMAQLEHQWSENLRLTLGGGVSYAETDYRQRFLQRVGPVLVLAEETVQEDSAGFLADLGLHWDQELYSLDLSYNRSISQDIEGDNRIRDRLSGSATYDLSSRLRLDGGASFVRSEDLADDTGGDEETSRSYGLFAGLRYLISERADLAFRYNFRYVDDDHGAGADDEESDRRNRVWLEYSYQLSFFPD